MTTGDLSGCWARVPTPRRALAGKCLKRLIGIAVAGMLLCDGDRRVAAAAQTEPPPLQNVLADSSSPYLRSAADQPVHWQEWSSDVFALARTLERPIYLHIGATWCHGCHQMDIFSAAADVVAVLAAGPTSAAMPS